MNGITPGVSKELAKPLKQARNVRKLQQSVVASPVQTGCAPSPEQAFSIDAQLLWDILVYDRAGLPSAGTESVDSLTKEQPLRAATEDLSQGSEFNLVGSAGITGHRSAGAHIPVYAPGDDAVYASANAETNPGTASDLMAPMGSSMEGIYGSGIDGFNDQTDPLFLADDYGRAIDGWLNYF